MAEIFGSKDGLCGGKGGSMHIADLAKGMMGANGIVGGGPPLICGAALSAKKLQDRRRRDRLRRRRRLQPGHHARSLQPGQGLESAGGVRGREQRLCRSHLEQSIRWPATSSTAPRASACRASRRRVDFFAVYDAAQRGIARARDGGGRPCSSSRPTAYFGHFEGDAGDLSRRRARSRRCADEKDCLVSFRRRVIEAGAAGRRAAGRDRRRGRAAGRPVRCAPPRRRAMPTGGRPAHRRLRLLLTGARPMARKYLPAGGQRGAGPGDGARPSRHRHGRGRRRRRRRARRSGRLGRPAGRHQGTVSPSSGPSACSTRRSRKAPSSARPSAPRRPGCGRWPN